MSFFKNMSFGIPAVKSESKDNMFFDIESIERLFTDCSIIFRGTKRYMDTYAAFESLSNFYLLLCTDIDDDDVYDSDKVKYLLDRLNDSIDKLLVCVGNYRFPSMCEGVNTKEFIKRLSFLKDYIIDISNSYDKCRIANLEIAAAALHNLFKNMGYKLNNIPSETDVKYADASYGPMYNIGCEFLSEYTDSHKCVKSIVMDLFDLGICKYVIPNPSMNVYCFEDCILRFRDNEYINVFKDSFTLHTSDDMYRNKELGTKIALNKLMSKLNKDCQNTNDVSKSQCFVFACCALTTAFYDKDVSLSYLRTSYRIEIFNKFVCECAKKYLSEYSDELKIDNVFRNMKISNADKYSYKSDYTEVELRSSTCADSAHAYIYSDSIDILFNKDFCKLCLTFEFPEFLIASDCVKQFDILFVKMLSLMLGYDRWE